MTTTAQKFKLIFATGGAAFLVGILFGISTGLVPLVSADNTHRNLRENTATEQTGDVSSTNRTGFTTTRGLGSKIVCHVFNHLDDEENPIPDFPHDDCVDTPSPAIYQCSDGIDNDSDGFTDSGDPNCHTDSDPTNEASYDPNRDENGTLPICLNGIDDDNDGKIDLDDSGCSSATDDDETDSTGGGGSSTAQCSDGIDNDGDTFIDTDDPNCYTDNDPTNSSTYDPNRDEDGTLPICFNGIDDDGDGKVDLNDPGCSSATDDDETNESTGTSGGGSSGGGGGGTVVGLITSVVTSGLGGTPDFLPDPQSLCSAYLTSFIRTEQANDPEQVKRLQYVLRDFENDSVEVNGVYDSATLAAVHSLQTKYASDILTPWGVDFSTGYVYLTTRKKVNEIYCLNRQEFPLTIEEQGKIDATRARLGSQQPVVPTPVATSELSTPEQPIQGEKIPVNAFLEIGSAQPIGDSVAQLAGVAATVQGNRFSDLGSSLRKFLRGISGKIQWPPQ